MTAPTSRPTGRIRTASWRLRRQLAVIVSMGPARLATLVMLQALLAVIPVGMVYAFAGIVAAVATPGSDPDSAAVAVAVLRLGFLLVAQRLLELATEPAQLWAGRRVDVRFRTRLAEILARPATIAHGETESVRGQLAIVASDFQGHTPGSASVSWFALIAKLAAGGWCLVIVAQHSLWAAALALVLLVARRRLQQHSFQMVYNSWGLIGPAARRFDYWRRFHFDPAAAKEIRIFDLPAWSLDRFRGAALDKFAPVWSGRRAASRWSWLPFALGAVGAFAIFVILAAQSGLSASQAAQVIAAGLTALRLSEPAGENLAIEHARTIVRAAEEVECAAILAARPEDATTIVTPPVTHAPPHLRLENLRFSYPHDDRPVLRGIDLDVLPGATLAIVGANGAGKTTLVKLLARLYEPTSGRITVDNVDLLTLDVQAWRRHLAVMLQGFVRYDLTLRANVQFGAAERRNDRDFFESVRDRLSLDDLVDKLPQGWDTRLGTGRAGGVGLSGGEWQRVGLARAAFAVQAGRDVVVLDEPTAHLDAEAEARALDQLDAISSTATVIVVSHRLATVRHADQIIVMSGGEVREHGNHESLVAAGGHYARMYAAQAERYLAPVAGNFGSRS